MYHVSSSAVFSVVSYMHIHVCFIMYCSRLVVVVFQEMNVLLNLMLFVGSLNFISLPSFMIVSAELNQNKKKKVKLTISNLRPFLGI